MAQPKVRKFAGDLRFWEHGANGARVPVIPEPADKFGNQPLEQSSLTFSYEAGDSVEIKSKRRDARYQQIIHKDSNPGVTSVSITALEVPPAILARMLYGTLVATQVAAGTATDISVTVGSADTPVKLPHNFLLADPEPTFKKGAVDLVKGTDYTLDSAHGLLIPKSSGQLQAGDTVVANYKYDAYLETAISGGTTPSKSFQILGDMQDRISGDEGLLTIPNVDLTVDGDVDWFSDEPIQVTLTGPVIFQAGEADLYTFKIAAQSAG
ncbi:hypothetical protein J5H37_02155 [Stenotrophomonas maltophilia]|uniref:phage tail tube protein n=1 Tax=Stenotrophomonas TaxID=40323 RepID=UPI0013DAA4D1|nr:MULTISPECIES: hypothetical protein [Stenotrophomonas]MBA0254429.1 hypothetical protein [Stenotrophomonas maltophilia]MBA0479798.1 hypothetical protein [Stenotrophomonas maltophilia]MBA0488022.1 hypothetical protein [Stenotrophomonas maltophilia]MBA0492083.1 hypothetical protein [Stenotrophomonas maltophilia]MBN7828325.1 hypothetical protein [Stenotrophomonas maltophilia]